MSTEAIQQRLHDFCESWRPVRLPDKVVLPLIVEEYQKIFPDKPEEYHTYLWLLYEAETGLTRDEIYRRLWPGRPAEQLSAHLTRMRNSLNAGLLTLPCNHLSNYQIRIYPDPSEDPTLDDSERIETLLPTGVSWLPEVNLRTDFNNPHLRLACASYDAGDYVGAIEQFDRILDVIRQKLTLTNTEINQFLYFLAKTLLKLNWYQSLSELLSGPYRHFSTLLQDELNAEILQIDGIRYRQQLDVANAHACFDRALRLLDKKSRQHPNARLLGVLADTCVLKTQAYLDQTMLPGQDKLAQETMLELAEEWLDQARLHYSDYWQQTPTPTHYEGRLGGTHSFVTIIRSLTFPEALSEDGWRVAEIYARRGFEPEHGRKPFGIVAGKYALSILWLAQGKWLLKSSDDEARSSALGFFRKALTLLSDTYANNVVSGGVYMGARYELPKIKKAAVTLCDALAAEGGDAEVFISNMGLGVQDLGLRDDAQICIYTPLV